MKSGKDLPFTHPAMAPVASEMGLGSSERDQIPRRYISPMDLYTQKHNPDHKLTPEHMVIRAVLGGRDKSHLEEAWATHVEQCNELIARLEKRPVIADKPKEGDPSILYYHIPASQDLAIRLWDGNMQKYGLYCFDLFDTSKRIALNLPQGYKFCGAPNPGVYTTGGAGSELISWERAWKVHQDEIRPGQERFTSPEGSHLALVRPGEPPFYFALPKRAMKGIVFAQPTKH